MLFDAFKSPRQIRLPDEAVVKKVDRRKRAGKRNTWARMPLPSRSGLDSREAVVEKHFRRDAHKDNIIKQVEAYAKLSAALRLKHLRSSRPHLAGAPGRGKGRGTFPVTQLATTLSQQLDRLARPPPVLQGQQNRPLTYLSRDRISSYLRNHTGFRRA